MNNSNNTLTGSSNGDGSSSLPSNSNNNNDFTAAETTATLERTTEIHPSLEPACSADNDDDDDSIKLTKAPSTYAVSNNQDDNHNKDEQQHQQQARHPPPASSPQQQQQQQELPDLNNDSCCSIPASDNSCPSVASSTCREDDESSQVQQQLPAEAAKAAAGGQVPLVVPVSPCNTTTSNTEEPPRRHSSPALMHSPSSILIPQSICENITEHDDDDDDDDSHVNDANKKNKNKKNKFTFFSSPARITITLRKRYLFLLLSLFAMSWKRYGHHLIDQDTFGKFNMEDNLLQLQNLFALFNNDSANSTLSYLMQERKRPGYLLAEQGATAKYPIVMVPGFVTSGLEVWAGQECAKSFFRHRLWAAVFGARTFLTERECWRQHMMLDPHTGGDPAGIRLRAAQGFEATDYFLGNYWVWGKLVMSLADVGYTPSTMTMEPYDWRLSFPMLEQRDGYLTHLKYRVEAYHKSTGRKVVMASHSMGALLIHYFFAWVTTPEEEGGGGGGVNWVHDHVHTYINIAGSHLGVPKAASAILSGEMSDTIFSGMLGNMAETFFGRRLRRDLWASWGSLWSMIPKGGNALWGVGADMCPPLSNRSVEDNDPFCPAAAAAGGGHEHPLSPLIKMSVPPPVSPTANASGSGSDNSNSETNVTEPKRDDSMTPRKLQLVERLAKQFVARENHTLEDVIYFLVSYGSGLGPNTAAAQQISLLKSRSGNTDQEEDEWSSRVWHDPTRTPLPYAPDMKLYCLYGVGVDTERAYYYRPRDTDPELEELSSVEPPAFLDISIQNEGQNTLYGTRYVDGDGSVPLLSLGYLCADAWQRPETGLNPSQLPVITREYPDESEFSLDDPMRRGPAAADHVDILGNLDMTEDFLRIVTDFGIESVSRNRIVSDIQRIAQEINAHPLGGARLSPSLSSWSSSLSGTTQRWKEYLVSSTGTTTPTASE